MITPEKFIENVVYTNFGEMVEKKLFGGVVYLACRTGYPCQLKEILIRYLRWEM